MSIKSISITPTIDINGIKFGVSRKELRESLGLSYKEFKKTKYSKNTSDDFGFCHVYYDSNDRFEAIEFFENVSIKINNKKIFPGDLSTINSFTDDFEYDGYGYISKKLSIGISVLENKIESILFGKEKYYD